MKRLLTLAIAAALLAGATAAAFAQERHPMEPDPARVAEIAAMLREKPAGLGRPIDDREHWDALAKSDAYEWSVPHVAKEIGKTVPHLTEQFYREVAESGSRPAWYGFDHPRSRRLRNLVIAECLENKGRFVPGIEQALEAILAEQTWFIPLYGKRSVANYEGRLNSIDLYKSMRSWEVALADWLVGARLKPKTRRAIRENLERRTFDSFRKSVRGEHPADWWFRTTNNWNAVCLSGPVGAALTILDSREDRAFFIASAEKHIRNFLAGYPDDGYCTEGIGYWSFGFGHFLWLTETVFQATDGKLDFLQMDPNIPDIALYAARIEIADGVYPTFADCSPNSKPSEQILYYASRRLGLGMKEWDNVPLNRRVKGSLYQQLINAFPDSADAATPAKTPAESLGERSYFSTTGILVCRPGKNSKAQVAVCLKGGHNAEHHNHNDVGTFVVVTDAEAPLTDVGAEVYTKHTFSKRRYESDALNSYGHSVPVVAGQYQKSGREAAAKVLKTDFTDATDTIVMDLRDAYGIESVEKLERTFTYSRRGEGALTVTDEVAYASPQPFEVALTTLGNVKQLGPGSVLLYGTLQAVRADVETDDGDIAIRVEELKAQLRGAAKGTRVGIAFTKPVQKARIAVRVTAAEHPFVKDAAGILNGDFEQELQHWKIDEKEKMCSLSTEQAASGKYSLKVVDTSQTAGSSAWSNPIPMQPGKTYELRGNYYGVSGKDLAVVTRFFNRQNRQLHLPDDKVRLAGTVKLSGSAKKWEPFTKRFIAPEGTCSARLWIHSFAAAKVEGYLDDLEIKEITETQEVEE